MHYPFKKADTMIGLPENVLQLIETTKWTFAKSYAETWPHEYIVRKNVDE